MSATVPPASSTTFRKECPPLPMEIVQLIIDSLAAEWGRQQDRDLKACALVCRSWLHASRRWLFRDLSIGYRVLSNPASFSAQERRLVEILDQNPLLGENVRRLYYKGRKMDEEMERARVDPLFSTFLSLPRVNRLEIYCVRVDFEKASEHGCHFQAILAHQVSTGNLVKVALTGMDNLPIGDILAMPLLEGLDLYDCGLQKKGRRHLYSPLTFLEFGSKKITTWSLSAFRPCVDLETLVIG
ncbi:hypothetical protein CVT24_009758 [Panaeolus cyanescens]|uniref:F-box domain-containing protein n=1 Tax=Panaeolus cyanescens TaxID=181874 RepID=A0A409WRQ5_9AGAR|nr:hypothetical protein CVT24_009758 [Panaeolus cyanescens]